MNRGELWSFLRSVMFQGQDIALDYRDKGYEAMSARIDAAASERADKLWAALDGQTFVTASETPAPPQPSMTDPIDVPDNPKEAPGVCPECLMTGGHKVSCSRLLMPVSTLCAVCDQIKELHPNTHPWTAKAQSETKGEPHVHRWNGKESDAFCEDCLAERYPTENPPDA
jgi:hypothetical protein